MWTESRRHYFREYPVNTIEKQPWWWLFTKTTPYNFAALSNQLIITIIVICYSDHTITMETLTRRLIYTCIYICYIYPNKHDTLSNADLSPGHRLRRWPSNESASDKRLAFSGYTACGHYPSGPRSPFLLSPRLYFRCASALFSSINVIHSPHWWVNDVTVS